MKHPITLGLATLSAASAPALAATTQDFDGTGSPYIIFEHGVEGEAPPTILPGGPTGNFLRVVDGATGGTGGIVFGTDDDAGTGGLEISFDFRMNPTGVQADGIGFFLLDPATYPEGTVLDEETYETGLLPSALGIGLDIFDNGTTDPNNNHISIGLNGENLQTVQPSTDLTGNAFLGLNASLREAEGGSLLSVSLRQADGNVETLIQDLLVPGYDVADFRVAFGARTGAGAADHDLDNIAVTPIPEPAVLSMAAGLGLLGLRRRR